MFPYFEEVFIEGSFPPAPLNRLDHGMFSYINNYLVYHEREEDLICMSKANCLKKLV